MTPVDHMALKRRPLSAALSIAAAVAAALSIAGCRPGEPSSGHVAGWVLVDPAQRHPIIVSQQPTTTTVRVPRGADGLSAQQRAHVVSFLSRYRSDAGNSRLRIAVPSGAPNEVAAMAAAADVRNLIRELGFDESNVNIEAYHEDGDPAPPIRISYARYVAEAPNCGMWPTNIGDDSRNVPFPNFGCATQRNFAVMVANPADLLGPRGMTPRSAERVDQAWEKHIKGEATGSKRSGDEQVGSKGGG